MPQYGAYGMALEGRSHKEILAHFYTGTTLGRAGTKKLRVLLAEGRRAVSLTSPGAFSVVDGLGAKTALPKRCAHAQAQPRVQGPEGEDQGQRRRSSSGRGRAGR